jgi:DNA modification methylase
MQIADLNAAKYNPRKALKAGDPEFEKLKRSIEVFGLVDPPIWNSRTNTVVGGHQRLSVLKSLGYTEVDVVVVDLDETQEKALNVALNKVSGDWDIPLLTDLLKEISESDIDVPLTGFDLAEMNDLFGRNDKSEAQDDNFDVDKAASEPPFALPGDLWTLGRHRLLVGDATKAEDITRLMDGKKANLILTDPPYGVSYEAKAGKIANDDLRGEEFYKFLLAAFSAAESVLEDEGSFYLFHADTQGEIFRRAFREAGFKLSGVCQWVKPSLVLGRSPYQWQNEPILFGWKAKGKHKWYTGRAETTIWNFDKPKKNDGHPTMKPIPLLSYPIKNSSAPNGIVLDSFLGSGSTLIACEQTDRVCFGLEIDPKYASVVVKRYIAQVGGADNITVERGNKILKYSEVVGNG